MKVLFCFFCFLFTYISAISQSKLSVSSSISSQGRGHVSFIDFALSTKKHDFYLGIGKHINDINSDFDGKNSFYYHQGFAYNFLQSLSFKLGYRKFIGKENCFNFYPYLEGVYSSTGDYSKYFFEDGTSVVFSSTKNLIFINFNLGLGGRLPLNKNISILSQAGICPTFSIITGPAYEWLVQPTWQIGVNYKFD